MKEVLARLKGGNVMQEEKMLEEVTEKKPEGFWARFAWEMRLCLIKKLLPAVVLVSIVGFGLAAGALGRRELFDAAVILFVGVAIGLVAGNANGAQFDRNDWVDRNNWNEWNLRGEWSDYIETDKIPVESMEVVTTPKWLIIVTGMALVAVMWILWVLGVMENWRCALLSTGVLGGYILLLINHRIWIVYQNKTK